MGFLSSILQFWRLNKMKYRTSEILVDDRKQDKTAEYSTLLGPSKLNSASNIVQDKKSSQQTEMKSSCK